MLDTLAYIAFAIMGMALIFGVLLFLFLGAVGMRRSAKKPAASGTGLINPEDRNLDWLRQRYPAPRDPPPPLELDQMHVNYARKRRDEQEIAEIRRRLDASVGVTPPSNPVAQAPNSQ